MIARLNLHTVRISELLTKFKRIPPCVCVNFSNPGNLSHIDKLHHSPSKADSDPICPLPGLQSMAVRILSKRLFSWSRRKQTESLIKYICPSLGTLRSGFFGGNWQLRLRPFTLRVWMAIICILSIITLSCLGACF